MDSEQYKSRNEQTSYKGCCAGCGAACRSQDVMIEVRRFMEEARQTLCKLDDRCVSSSNPNPPQQSVEDKVSDTLFRSGRSIAALQTASEGLLMWDESGAALHCAVCSQTLQVRRA